MPVSQSVGQATRHMCMFKRVHHAVHTQRKNFIAHINQTL